jgi:hypothetical protein
LTRASRPDGGQHQSPTDREGHRIAGRSDDQPEASGPRTHSGVIGQVPSGARLRETTDRRPLEQQAETGALAYPEAGAAQRQREQQNCGPVGEGEQEEAEGSHDQAGGEQTTGAVAITEPTGPAPGADRGQGIDEERAGRQRSAGTR